MPGVRLSGSIFDFLTNISANISTFSKASAATVLSSLDNGDNGCVEKLEPIDFAKDQKDLLPLGQDNSLFLMETTHSDFANLIVLLQSDLAFKKAEWLMSVGDDSHALYV